MGFFSDLGSWAGDALSSVGGVASTIFPFAAGPTSSFGAFQQNKEAKAAAQTQMNFQERMSSTAYQRSMADMRKAGLNPILAYKGAGASSPGGSTYQPQNVMTPGVTSALASRQLTGQLKQMAADTKKKKEEAITTRAVGYKTDIESANAIKAGKILDEDLHSAKANAAQADVITKMYKSQPGEYLKILELLRRTFGK